MKTFKRSLALILFAAMTIQVTTSAIKHRPAVEAVLAGYIDVYLVNNCSKEVEVRVRADGSSSTSKYKAGEKTKVPVKEGYEIYVDSKLVKKIENSDSGKEIKLCK